MKSNHQMTEEQQNVFERHCRSSETITKVKIPWYLTKHITRELVEAHLHSYSKPSDYPDKVYKIKGYDKDAPFGVYFWEHWPKHLQKDLDETDDKHHNGAFQQRYMRGRK